MPAVPVHVRPDADDPALRAGFAAIRRELGIDAAFPLAVTAAARASAALGPQLPAAADLRDVDFFSIDPPGSRDLDQAVAIETRAGGHLVRYAIADVAAFVEPGDAIDVESRRRGVTVYLPDGRAPLHPVELSEGAASLLAGSERQAVVWTFVLDGAGDVASVELGRATIRNRKAWTYPEAQEAADGDTHPEIALLRDVGRRRLRLAAERGAVELPVPDQEIVRGPDGRWALAYRAPLPVERWNAEISLMTGMAAAALMVVSGTALLRTLPPPPGDVTARLRRTARALGVPWPEGAAPGDVIRTLEPAVSADHAAFAIQAARLLRGAGYEVVGGEGAVMSAVPEHAGVGAAYAHVTAPLRRLVDRFATELCLAAHTGRAAPEWVVAALAEVPTLMAEARRREGSANRMSLDLVEAAVLAQRLGEEVDAVVVDIDREGTAQVQVRDPAVVARVRLATEVGLGDEVTLRVVGADVARRRVELVVTG